MSTDWRPILQETALLCADLGLTYLFYKIYRNRCSRADKVNGLETLELSELKEAVTSYPNSTIEYAIVEGDAHPISEPIKSQFTEAEGPLRLFKRVLMKSERHKGFWVDGTSMLSESYDTVPFMLKSAADSSSILVTDPKSAEFVTEAMHTTHDHFEPNTRTFLEGAFDRVMGSMSKGIQTTETILKSGTTLLGVGKIVYNKGRLEIRKPTIADSAYILTNMTKEELVQKMKSKAFVFKLVAGIFGSAGILIFCVTYGMRFKQWAEAYLQRRENERVRRQLREMRSQASREDGNTDAAAQENNPCVICMSRSREIALRPCGHVCTCLGCYEAMPGRKVCPVCRARVAEVVPVFIP